MAYTEQDRTLIRHYAGYGAIFLQAEPRLENAITATQSQAEGGARPDSSTENFIKGLIYGVAAVAGVAGVTPGGTSQTATTFAQPGQRGLLTVEANIAGLDVQRGALQASRVRIDSARETIRLRMEGRRLAHSLARMLGMKGVRADIFRSAPVIVNDDPFAYDNRINWGG